MQFSTILATLATALVATVNAAPSGNFAMMTRSQMGGMNNAVDMLAGQAFGIEARGDSGCYPFSDPGCGIDYSVCQCNNGWVYEFNPDSPGGCQPPWGFLGTSVSQLGGWSC